MERTLRDREILKGIRDLSSKRATGKLQITTGTTQGAIFFDKGQIVDANLGKLNGFQAINAIASIPDGTFDFDPSISPPVQHLNFSERWVLTEVFGLKVQSEPKYSPAEPSDDAPTPPIPLNDIEEQPSSGVVELEIEQVHELSATDPAAVPTDTAPLNIQEQPPSTYYSKDDDIIPDNAPSKWSALKAFFRRKVQREPEYLVSVNEPSDDAPTPAIFLNDVEAQPNARVVQVEIEPVHELSSLDPAAMTLIATRFNTDEQLLTTHYSNHEDSIPDDADEVEVITGIAHLNDYRPVIFYEPSSQLRLRPTFVAAVLGILLGVITAAPFYRSRELSLQHPPVVQTSSSANVPATQTPGFSSEVVSAAPDLTGKRVKVSENRQSFTRARKAPIEVKRSILHTKRPLIFRAAPRQEQVASTISPSSPPRPSIARQSATPWREPAFRPAVAPAADPQPPSDANVLKRGANESIRGLRFVSSRVGSWVGSVFGKKKRSAQ